MNEAFDSFIPLFAFPFFGVQIAFPKKEDALLATKKYLVPSLHKYFEEEVFADIYGSWDDEGIYFHFSVRSEAFVGKEPRKSDSIELFFNTKPQDGRTFFTQFCHHFILTPEEVDGALFREVTKFRTEETHSLVAQQQITITAKVLPGKYFIDCMIPFATLHGYSESHKDPLTFFYRINRKDGNPQSLSASSQEYDPQKTPLLWSQLSFS